MVVHPMGVGVSISSPLELGLDSQVSGQTIWNLAIPYIEVSSISKFFDIEVQNFDIEVQHFYIIVQHFDIEATKKASISKFIRYRSCCFDFRCQNLRASISKCMYFDIGIWILRYRSTLVEYRTLYRSTSKSKLKNFDIEVHWNWISHPISKHFDIEVS